MIIDEIQCEPNKPIDGAQSVSGDTAPSFPSRRTLQSWKEIAIEIAVVVIGIVIAVGLDQLVEEIHWTTEVKKARSALQAEAADANAVFAYRIAASDCVVRKLAFLENVTERAAMGMPVPGLGMITPNIGYALSDSTWQAQRASQVLTHFDRQELLRFGDYYYQLSNMQRIIDDEYDGWQTLRILEGDPARLSAPDFANLRVALKKALSNNGLIVTISRQQLEDASRLKLLVNPMDRERLTRACEPVKLLVDTARTN